MKEKQWLKNILSALVIMGGGFVLFNLAFLLTALVVNGLRFLSGGSEGMVSYGLGRFLALFLMIIITYFILKYRKSHTVKATFLTMPLMVILVLMGISFYGQAQWVLFGAGALFLGGVILYIYKKKLPWQYYFATFYVGLLGLYIILAEVEI